MPFVVPVDKDGYRGKWRTVSGRKIFIRDGESLSGAMQRSGKFGKKIKYTGVSDKTKESTEEAIKYLKTLYPNANVDELIEEVKLADSKMNRTVATASKGLIEIHSEKNVDTAVMVHEIQHLVNKKILDSKIPHSSTKEEDAFFNNIRKTIYKRTGLKASKANDVGYVSRYSATNSDEFLAEIAKAKYKKFNNAVLNEGIKYLNELLKD